MCRKERRVGSGGGFIRKVHRETQNLPKVNWGKGKVEFLPNGLMNN